MMNKIKLGIHQDIQVNDSVNFLNYIISYINNFNTNSKSKFEIHEDTQINHGVIFFSHILRK